MTWGGCVYSGSFTPPPGEITSCCKRWPWASPRPLRASSPPYFWAGFPSGAGSPSFFTSLTTCSSTSSETSIRFEDALFLLALHLLGSPEGRQAYALGVALALGVASYRLYAVAAVAVDSGHGGLHSQVGAVRRAVLAVSKRVEAHGHCGD